MTTFVEALHQRYSESMLEDSSIELFIVGSLSPGKSGNHLTLPPAVSLTRCEIYKSGSENVIRDCCRNVEELDLASNNLTDLNQIFNIVKEMPFLKFLNLSENDFSKVNVDEVKAHELHNVKHLVLNNTSIPWQAIDLLLDNMPNLQDLHICLNNYKTVEGLPKCYNVQRIYISKNPHLTNFEQIKNLLICFPHLKSLTMADCNVAEVPADLHTLLPSLRCLNISNWPINSWTMIDNLNSLPELVELRCIGCKILDEFENLETRRNMLIARLPKIKRLNGSEIIDDERLHAERHFVRWFDEHKDVEKPSRYYELFNKYGAIPALAKVCLKPDVTAKVKVIYIKNQNDKENDNGEQSKVIKINLKQSVKELKVQLSTLFNLPVARIRLFYCDMEVYDVSGPEEMKFGAKKLYTYKIRDGDQILIDEK